MNLSSVERPLIPHNFAWQADGDTLQLLRRLHRPQEGHLWACERCAHRAHTAPGGPQTCQHPNALAHHPQGQHTPHARAFGGHCGPEATHHQYQAS